MKNKTKYTIKRMALIAMMATVLTGCVTEPNGETSQVEQAEQETQKTRDLSIETHLGSHEDPVIAYVIIDSATGVQYIVTESKGFPSGVTMTPRLNLDGTLYSEVD